jgi:hypothetical protein
MGGDNMGDMRDLFLLRNMVADLQWLLTKYYEKLKEMEQKQAAKQAEED